MTTRLWSAQRAGQRCPDGIVLKVSHRLTGLGDIIAAARSNDATVVTRAGLGLSWLRFAGGDPARAGAARGALAPRPCLALDGAARVDNPGLTDPALRALTERVKARFDPERRFRPGAFGGI